jgi:hypothetical protein
MVNTREVVGFLALIGLVFAIGQTHLVTQGLDNLGDAIRLWYYRTIA